MQVFEPILEATHWGIEQGLVYLNHGAYGLTTKEVLAEQTRCRAELQRNPVEILYRQLTDRLADKRASVAGFVGAAVEGLVLVPNATFAINAVLNSLPFREGDEIIIASHCYSSVAASATYLASRYRVRIRVVRIPIPLASHEEVTAAFADAMSEATRLVIVDHIASASALVMPVADIIKLAHDHNIAVLVDGAHVPGQLELDVTALGADFYCANLHKWLFTPLAVGFLYVGERWRRRIHPPLITYTLGQGLAEEFSWPGTYDPTAWLAIDAGLACYERLGGAQLLKRNHELALAGFAGLLADSANPPPYPASADFLASMFGLPLAKKFHGDLRAIAKDLTARFYREHQIEVNFSPIEGRIWVRASAQAYNHSDDYLRLGRALQAEGLL